MLSELWIRWTANLNRFEFSPQYSTRAEWKLSGTFRALFVRPNTSSPAQHEMALNNFLWSQARPSRVVLIKNVVNWTAVGVLHTKKFLARHRKLFENFSLWGQSFIRFTSVQSLNLPQDTLNWQLIYAFSTPSWEKLLFHRQFSQVHPWKPFHQLAFPL